MLHFLTNHKFDLLSYFYIINFLNLPLCALIHDLQKKNLRASTRTHDPFFDNSEIWPTFIYRGEVPAHTFAKLPVHALINDPKKLFQKKVYVTIPQWFETFPNMSHLRSGQNRAKCGLVLNDPIDWFKLRLNQPKTGMFSAWIPLMRNLLGRNHDGCFRLAFMEWQLWIDVVALTSVRTNLSIWRRLKFFKKSIWIIDWKSFMYLYYFWTSHHANNEKRTELWNYVTKYLG